MSIFAIDAPDFFLSKPLLSVAYSPATYPNQSLHMVVIDTAYLKPHIFFEEFNLIKSKLTLVFL